MRLRNDKKDKMSQINVLSLTFDSIDDNLDPAYLDRVYFHLSLFIYCLKIAYHFKLTFDQILILSLCHLKFNLVHFTEIDG